MILFEWDKAKNRTNLLKHGIEFEAARSAFYDPMAQSLIDREVEGEQRWQTTGTAEGKGLLLVVYTLRDEGDHQIIRIISARVATRRERRNYEESD